mgnify:CR=1 FL=1
MNLNQSENFLNIQTDIIKAIKLFCGYKCKSSDFSILQINIIFISYVIKSKLTFNIKLKIVLICDDAAELITKQIQH